MNFELIDDAFILAKTNKNFDHSVGYHDIKPAILIAGVSTI